MVNVMSICLVILEMFLVFWMFGILRYLEASTAVVVVATWLYRPWTTV
jgi:hypothetical protein